MIRQQLQKFQSKRGRQCISCAEVTSKPTLTFQWTWGPPPLPVRSKRSLLNAEERGLFDLQTLSNAPGLQAVVLSCTIHVRTLVQNINSDNVRIWNFLPCVCSQLWWNLHTLHGWRTGSGQWNGARINTAGLAFCYKLCYLLSLLWEVDLWLSSRNER